MMTELDSIQRAKPMESGKDEGVVSPSYLI